MKTNRNENAGDVEILIASDSVLAVNPRVTFRWSGRSSEADGKTRSADGGEATIGLPTLKPEERTLLALADGRRSVESLAKLAGMTTPVAVRHLRALCDRGILINNAQAEGRDRAADDSGKWAPGESAAPASATSGLSDGAPTASGVEAERVPTPASAAPTAAEPAPGPGNVPAAGVKGAGEREKKGPSGPNVTLFWIPATAGSGPSPLEGKLDAGALGARDPSQPRRNAADSGPSAVGAPGDGSSPVVVGGSGPVGDTKGVVASDSRPNRTAAEGTVIVAGSGPSGAVSGGVPPTAEAAPSKSAAEGAPSAIETPGPSVAIPFRVGGYEVATRIAQGAMGSIYVCRRVGAAGFQRLFTMKVIRQYSTQREIAAKSFQREAQFGAVLNHPNVQAVVDVGDYEGQPFLILDYVEGTSLLDLLADDRRPSAAVVVAVILDLLRGLQHVHDVTDEDGNPRGLVHGDVSPHNVLVGVDGVSRLTDFGSARATKGPGAEKDTVAAGKPAYMAPEQLRGEPVDARTDLFSVGAVMWTALTGQRLFAADTYQETVVRVMRRKIPPPSEFGAPASLDAVVMRALSRSPEGRYASAEEMARELSAAATPENLVAPEREVGQWVRREYGEVLADRKRKVQEAFGVPAARAGGGTSQPARPHRPTPKTSDGLERLPAKTVLLEAGEIKAALGEARSASHRTRPRQDASRAQWALVISSAVIAAFALTAAIIYLISSLNTPPRRPATAGALGQAASAKPAEAGDRAGTAPGSAPQPTPPAPAPPGPR